MTEQLKIWDVIEGPIWDVTNQVWYIIAKVEDPRGGFEEEEISGETFEELLEVVNHFKGQIVPFTIELDEEVW